VSTYAWLSFTPRDTVFVRDGRSFNAAADAFAQTVFPGPATMAGAVGAAFGISRADVQAGLVGDGSVKHVTQEVRGPVLARRRGDTWEPYFPFPADLVRTADESDPYVYRLLARERQREQPAKTDLGLARWLVQPHGLERVEPVRGWIPGSKLAAYLAGDLPDAEGTPLEEFDPLTRGGEPPRVDNLADPFRPETRVGLARDDRRVRPGYLYQAAHLRFEEDWAFLAEYTVPEEWDRRAKRHVPFGGKRRLADVGAAAMGWPAPGKAGKRVLVYLATPAVWPEGWRLPVPGGASLIAAATGDPQPAASVTPGPGWERTRELRWAVPAGSVYLLEFPDADSGAEWAATWHGKALDRRVSGQPDLLRSAGFGVALTGAWSD
jgi:CRISPR-associated protein Cmr3